MLMLFRNYTSTYDNTLLNYKQMREDIGILVQRRVEELKINPIKNQLDPESMFNQPLRGKELNQNSLSRLNELKNFDVTSQRPLLRS